MAPLDFKALLAEANAARRLGKTEVLLPTSEFFARQFVVAPYTRGMPFFGGDVFAASFRLAGVGYRSDLAEYDEHVRCLRAAGFI